MVIGSRLDTSSKRDSTLGGSEVMEGMLRDARSQGLKKGVFVLVLSKSSAIIAQMFKARRVWVVSRTGRGDAGDEYKGCEGARQTGNC
jgi:hypothetical protein